MTVQRADAGDTQTIQATLVMATEQLEATVGLDRASALDVVTDKGYHSNEVVTDLDALGVRTGSVPSSGGLSLASYLSSPLRAHGR